MRHFKRLTKRGDFLRAQRGNQKFITSSVVIQVIPNDIQGKFSTRVGFTASKKIGNAVKRNYAKRLMRSLVYRQSDELASSFDYVFIARQAILNKKFYLIESEIMRALKHLSKSIFE